MTRKIHQLNIFPQSLFRSPLDIIANASVRVFFYVINILSLIPIKIMISAIVFVFVMYIVMTLYIASRRIIPFIFGNILPSLS